MKISVSILNSEDKKEMIKTLNNTNISYIHMDVMDGQFVPQRTLSYPELQELSGISTKKLDIHLMMDSPEEYIDNIYTGVLASSIGICNNKSEIIQSVLISTLSFYIAQEASIELFKYQFEDDIDKNDINLVNEYLLEEISKINVDKIKSYGDVEYYFKRNR